MSGTERAQSEVLGTVLLLGLTVAVVGSTVALGGAALDDSQTRADLQRAEGAMTQLDSEASLVAHGESPSQRASVGTNRGRVSVDDDAGRMVIAENGSGEEILNESLTALVYERDGTRIAYQGGGVWRSDGDGAHMVSEPEFHYRGETLTVPLITVADGADVDGGELLVTADGPPERRVDRNPITDDVTVTVTGDYHEGWAAFFEARTDSRIVERNADSVTVTLQDELVGDGVPQSLGALGNSELDLESIGSLYADSYDSAGVGPSESNDGAVVAAGGSIDAPQGGPDESVTIKGDLLARDDINNPDPSGIKNGNPAIDVTGTVAEGAEIDDPNPVDGYLLRAFTEYEDRYSEEPTTTYPSWSEVPNSVREPSVVEDGLDVDGTDSYRVEGTEIDASADGGLSIDGGGRVTLEAAGGNAGFRFDDLDVQSGELVLDTSDGDLDLYAEDDVSFGGEGSNPATLRVVGDGTVRLYARDEVSLQQNVNVEVDPDAEIRIFHDDPDDEVEIGGEDGGEGVSISTGPNEPADSFWLFSNAAEIDLDGSDAPADITGTIYAPNAEVDDIEGDVTVRGAIVVDSFEDLEDADLTIRYDEALATAEVFDEVEAVPTIKNLHVSTQEIRIESD